MPGNNLRTPQQKYKTAHFRRQIIERLRLQIVTEERVLTQLGISHTLLNRWNRIYRPSNLEAVAVALSYTAHLRIVQWGKPKHRSSRPKAELL